MIPDEELKRWKALSEKATAGDDDMLAIDGWYVGPEYRHDDIDGPIHDVNVCIAGAGEIAIAERCVTEDAAFIAAARDAVPRLIAEVEHYRTAHQTGAAINDMLTRRVAEGNADRDRLRGLLDRACQLGERCSKVITALSGEPMVDNQWIAIREEAGL